jgi:outer membrane immunogenic protein
MRKLLLGSVVATFVAGPALAADLLPEKAPIPAPPPPPTWTGFYIGLNAGAVSADSNWKNLDGLEAWFPSSSLTNTTAGFIGGGQVGYNWQTGHAVFGLEADMQYTSLNQTTNLQLVPVGFGLVPLAVLNDQIKWLATVRGRSGLAVDNVLVYLTGGLAVGQVNHTYTTPTIIDPDDAFAINKTKVGWTVGAGLEYMLWQNWTVRTEVLYADLGKSSTTFNDVDGSCFFAPAGCRFEVRDTMWIGRLGVNYKFY